MIRIRIYTQPIRKNLTLFTKQRKQIPLIKNNKGTDEGVNQYKGLLQSRAWAFYKTTGLPYEELYSVCTEAYAKAINAYDSTRAQSFTTMLYWYCNNALINFCKYEKIETRQSMVDWDSLSYLSQVERTIDIKRIIRSLSDEGQAVVDILFNCPGELLELVQDSYNSNMDKPRNIKCALKKFLKKLHWPEHKIKNTFNEIQAVVAGL